MPDAVQESYDKVAKLYAELFLGDVERDQNSKDWLATFAELAAAQSGRVADLGCGPGHVVDHLSRLGLSVVGYDLSPGQIAEARRAFPEREFHVGDFMSLGFPDSSLGGIVSRYSIIHFDPSRLDEVFAEWFRALASGAPLLLSFFGSTTAETHGTAFGHTVATAYELFPATIAQHLENAGFTDVDVGRLDPPEDGRPFDQATVLARSPAD